MRGRRLELATLLILLLIMAPGCSEDEECPVCPDALEMVVYPDSLTFQSSGQTRSFFITKTGAQDLAWRIVEVPLWLAVSPDSGVVTEGVQEVQSTADTEALLAGTHVSNIGIFSNAGSDTVVVRAHVGEYPSMRLEPDSVHFAFSDTLREIQVINDGNTSLDWAASAGDWLLLQPGNSGTVTPGDTVPLGIVVDRTGMESGSYSGHLIVSTVSGLSDTVGIGLDVYLDVIHRLGYGVIDAEYSSQLERVILVSSTSDDLFIHDPETGTEQSVSLPLSPLCVSVGPGGQYAAVGHDGYISYVNLTTALLEATLSVTCEVFDVVLAGNGYVYAFPEGGQWESIRCVEIATNTESLHTGNSVFGNTRAKLHPSGDAIYGTDNGLLPCDVEKYDITGGTAAYLYDSPYHGDYDVCGDLWMSEGGLRVFTRCGNVFRSSTTPSEDMTYNGSICEVTHLTHSAAVDRVFVIPWGGFFGEEEDTELRVYHYDFLSLEEAFQLPGFLVGDTLYAGHGRFVFATSDGAQCVVVLQADDDSGLLNDFGIVSLDWE